MLGARAPPPAAELRRHRRGDTMAAAVHHAVAPMSIATNASDFQTGPARGAAGARAVAR